MTKTATTIEHPAVDADTGKRRKLLIELDHHGLSVETADGQVVVLDCVADELRIYLCPAKSSDDAELVHTVLLASTSPDPIELFNAMCDMVIYHVHDLLRPTQVNEENPGKFERSIDLCVAEGLMEWDSETRSWVCGEKLVGRYNSEVEAYAMEHFPDEYSPSFDYWGARCIKHNARGSKGQHPFAGDGMYMYMLFDEHQAMVEYTERALAEAQEAEGFDDD